MNSFLGEMIGTALLILLGDGVVANVVLRGTKGSAGGWIVITAGWALAVFVGVLFAAGISGAHLNPAVTIALAVEGRFDSALVPAYLTAQMIGACIGAFLVWLMYRDHFEITDEPNAQLAVFCTGPAIRNPVSNTISEIIGTFVLVFAALHVSSPKGGLGSLDALPIAAVVFAIGLCLGGTTGYAINPARDLGPRIMHSLLPMRGKRDSDWSYSWIPVIGPIVGGVLAALLFRMIA